ncbi:MAG: hypothetical protein OHK93_008259 [Ramalina farinacea]|uniref:Uncharacterized protein n=1 Tax=Ramalina farinacea TaxID=258253 RepID=A0AA43QM39_9LECA|nr:hypothetical protein [Ramalina farinacea]
MCRIERYNLIFPDGHSEVREQLLNTCPRGTPSSPCHHREYVQVFRDRFATREENDEYLRRTAPLIEPTRGSTLREVQKSKKPKSVLQNLGIGFKMWHPFSSEKKEREKQKKYIKERSRRSLNQITVVEPMPRAPSPPLAWTPRPQEPFCMTAGPGRERGRPTNRHLEEQEPKVIRPKRKHARRPTTVIVHQEKKKPKKSRRKHEESESDSDYDSDPEDDVSSSERVRPYQRPHRSPSPVPIITPNRELERERNRRYRAERRSERAQKNAQAEHDARVRAEQIAAAEQHEQRRIAHQDRMRLESAERGLAALEANQRARDAQEQQRLLDRETIRMRNMQTVGLTSRHPTRNRPVSLHHPGDQMMATGNDFIDRSIANAEANMRMNAGPLPRGGRGGRGGLMRRNTDGGGAQGRGYGGHGRGHQRGRWGGSG